MEKYTVGIVGFGVVGKAVGFGFIPQHKVIYHDPIINGSIPMRDVAMQSDVIFVSVPTPEASESRVDDTIITEVMSGLDKLNPKGVVVIKSTVTPDLLLGYEQRFKNLKIVFNPEFLTERSARFDFINQTRIILGGCKENTALVAEIYATRFPHLPIYQCDLVTASLIKYMCNCFFALKVSYLNEFYKLFETLGLVDNWESIINMWLGDCRIGTSHSDVPGPDGRMGFGGKCFPKDTSAAVCYAENIGTRLRTIEAARKTNEEVRGPKKDW